MLLILASRPKALVPPFCLVKLNDLHQCRMLNLSADELGHSVAGGYLVVLAAKVVEEYKDLSIVLFINYAGSHVDHVLRGQPGAWSDAPVAATRNPV